MYRRLKFSSLNIVLLAVGLLGAATLLNAQPQAPNITCATVNDDGTVTLNWQAPADPGNEFFNYEIFFNDGSGNGYQSLGYWGGINNTSYQHFGIDASTQSYSYVIQTLYAEGNGVSDPSDTVSTLQLELTPQNLNSVALLEWNNPGQAIEAASDGEYHIMREYPAGNVQEIGSVPTSTYSYKDTLFGICVEQPVGVNYWVELQNGGCISRSDVETDEFQDLLGPGVPQVETITINPMTGDAEVYWDPVDAPDLDQYLIQRVNQQADPDEFINAGMEDAGGNTFFVFGPPPADGALNMVVIAFDECGNDNSYDQIARTMYLQSEYTQCSLEVSLRWTPYNGWDEGVEKYQVLESLNGGTGQVIANLEPNARTYTASVNAFDDACYYVKAVSQGDQIPSNSNKTCVTATYPDFSEVNYLSKVSKNVDGSTQVELHTDGTGEGMTFKLQQANGNPDNFKTIATLNQPAGNTLSYQVPEDPTTSSVQYYRWKAMDACGGEVSTSNLSRTMKLRAIGDPKNLMSRISWNSYTGWDGGVEEYRLYRRLGNNGEFELIDTLDAGTTNYKDSVDSYLLEEGNFCYRVQAVEQSNSFGFARKAYSTIGCATQEPLIFIPNAIYPGGVNKVFKPVAGFLDFDRYHMVILNRWDHKIFSTQDISQGWDATFNGKPVPPGVYFYFITFFDGAGNNISRKGELYVLD